MNYKDLVREAIKLLDMYEPDKQCMDTFIEDSIKTLGVYLDMNFSHILQSVLSLMSFRNVCEKHVVIFSVFQNRPSAEQIFITDTVYGCIVHRKLLDIVINVFYDQKGKYFLKADRNHFVGTFTMFTLWEKKYLPFLVPQKSEILGIEHAL